eukprot:scaffold1309_cov117-Isochrysis_galbana.AAC.15
MQNARVAAGRGRVAAAPIAPGRLHSTLPATAHVRHEDLELPSTTTLVGPDGQGRSRCSCLQAPNIEMLATSRTGTGTSTGTGVDHQCLCPV